MDNAEPAIAEPLDVAVEGGVYLINGPNNTAFVLTETAFRETVRRLNAVLDTRSAGAPLRQHD